MAHDLETQNGKTSFASFREPAWHGLGTVFTEEKTTAEMLRGCKPQWLECSSGRFRNPPHI